MKIWTKRAMNQKQIEASINVLHPLKCTEDKDSTRFDFYEEFSFKITTVK